MNWRGRRGSRNIIDRRSRRSSGGSGGGRSVGGIGLVVLLLAGVFFGVDVTPFLSGGGDDRQEQRLPQGSGEDVGQFVSVVLADTEEIWARLFRDQLGKTYGPPQLVLFRGVTDSPCGNASGATGPFYCPANKRAYLDTNFFETMARRMGAGGDFAAAYVVAHEVAHHVQKELGILDAANAERARVGQAAANRISVQLELQADCLSGVWARGAAETFGTIEPGDLEEALNAARQIGDDTLQRNAGRTPAPHTFTHGTSEQRMTWFARGLKSGAIGSCDTFGADRL